MVGWGHLGEEPGHHEANVLPPLGGVGVVSVQVLGKLQRHDLKLIWKEAEMGEWVSPGRPAPLPLRMVATPPGWSRAGPGCGSCGPLSENKMLPSLCASSCPGQGPLHWLPFNNNNNNNNKDNNDEDRSAALEGGPSLLCDLPHQLTRTYTPYDVDFSPPGIHGL